MVIKKGRLILAAMVLIIPLAAFLAAWKYVRDQRVVSPISPDAELDSKKLKLIWDNEHITFEIEKRFGTAFLKALLKKQQTKITAFLRSGFQAQVLYAGQGAPREKESFKETRNDRSTSGSFRVGPKQFAESLLKIRERFGNIQQKKLRVLGIEKKPTLSPQWKTRLLLVLVGTDDKNRPLIYESEHHAEFTIVDEMKIDATAVLDSWQVEHENWRNTQSYVFEEVTDLVKLSEAPVPDNWLMPPSQASKHTFQVAIADFNLDGYPDIAVSINKRRSILLKSIQGKKFQDVTEEVNLASVAKANEFVATWIDYNNDGYPDLILNNRLYENIKGQQFKDVTGSSGLKFAKACMGVIVADYDCDGRLDIYALYENDHNKLDAPGKKKWVDEEESGMPNQLWRNEGNGRFRDVTAETNAGGGNCHSFAASWFYFDDDRFPDLYIANDFGKNVILRNTGYGTFERVTAKTGAEDFATSMGVATGDIDNNGQTDIYVANMFSKMGRRIIGQVCDADYPVGVYDQIKGSCAGNRLYLKQGDSKYRDVSEQMGVNAVGWAFGPALFDIDGDGWLDIYACSGFMSFSRKEPDG